MGTRGDFFDSNRSCEYHGDSETADEVCKAGEEGADDGEDMQGSASAGRLLVEGKRRKKPMQMITAVSIS